LKGRGKNERGRVHRRFAQETVTARRRESQQDPERLFSQHFLRVGQRRKAVIPNGGDATILPLKIPTGEERQGGAAVVHFVARNGP